ncbi:MAG: protein kinase [Gemmatimonadota bacterium]|nr:MAG: protein kinase [Gemmatimonadota bacterium]
MVMACYDGESLDKKIGRGPLNINEAVDIASQIAQGLSKAHEKEIIHRDIKPANIFITEDGVVKILDFGLAKLKGRPKITKEGTTLGTVAYMSPEQARGEEVDHRTDIWSLGVILYEMMTGRNPFEGDYEQAIIYSIMNEDPEPITGIRTGVPMELERIVNKALAKHPDDRYQHADELLTDLRRERRQSEYLKSGQLSPGHVKKTRKKLSPFIVPTAIVFIFVILFFIFKPFQIEIGPQREVVAEENRLAIMYFNNLAEPEDSDKLGEIAANLLITDLTESHYLDVVSSQRLYDILKLLGREGEKRIDRDVATEVARKAGSRWMLLGSILQVKPQIIITSQLVDVGSGSAIASQRITGAADDNIFTLVDKLTVEIKNDLTLPDAAREEPDRPVADVTTHSPQAYRYYLEGMDYNSKLYDIEAEKSFEKALEYDSTFAMAYYRLSILKGGSEKKEMIAKAVAYSDKVSWKEKKYIKTREAYASGDYIRAIEELQKIVERYPEEKEAFLWLGYYYDNHLRQSEQAIRSYSKAIEIDPLYKNIYKALAYLYDDVGDFEKSIWAINKYISLAPDEANPYDSRADLYAYNGKIDQAIESYKKALEIKSDFYVSLAKLGHMYLFQREYPRAESFYQKLCSSTDKDIRSRGRLLLAFIPLHQGKLERTLQVLDDGIAADRMEQAGGWYNALKYVLKTIVYEEKGNLNLALTELEKSIEIYGKYNPEGKNFERASYAWLLAENGDFEKAEEVAEALREYYEENDPSQMYDYWCALGWIEKARGNVEASVTSFEKAAKDVRYFWVLYPLAKAYLQSGRLGEAVAEFERVLTRHDEYRAFFVSWAVKAHYLLGLAYEKSGWNTKAVEQYEEFLDIWKDADSGIEEVEDAKSRLARLTQKS